MLLRALAVLAALAIPLLLSVDAISGLHAAMFWVGPLAAIAATLPIVLKAGPNRGQALVGAALAAMAAAASPELPELLEVTGELEDMPVHDLRQGPLPPTREGYVAVQGYLRNEYVVDEYRPLEGQRPDQNQAPEAVLLPLLGTREAEVVGAELGLVIVARVRPEQVGPGLVTLRGRIAPVGEEIVDSLFMAMVETQAGKTLVPLRPDAVMLDTLDLPTRGQALTRTALALGAALLGLILLVFAIPKPEADADAA